MKMPQLILPIRNVLNNLSRNHATKTTTQNLINYPKVKLLSNGKILYLLISIYMHGETLFSRTIVHGARAKKHIYVYDNVRDELESLGLCSRALGGGIMDFDPQARTMTIQGKCETFGRADHTVTKQILLGTPKYKDYKITVGR
ncbi:sex-regulated protein janus-B-like isoform X2 [Drosophila hydei]|uniref:Sex-regulated protein janus-B-like isoform X2 n=1 Tax=Drosophila hydei TaxID=7224 RepID=A0A6J1LDU9_DROHY|nr:sex-regulated protein janus-B-like isoform X2 [Drosophila hydei]